MYEEEVSKPFLNKNAFANKSGVFVISFKLGFFTFLLLNLRASSHPLTDSMYSFVQNRALLFCHCCLSEVLAVCH